MDELKALSPQTRKTLRMILQDYTKDGPLMSSEYGGGRAGGIKCVHCKVGTQGTHKPSCQFRKAVEMRRALTDD